MRLTAHRPIALRFALFSLILLLGVGLAQTQALPAFRIGVLAEPRSSLADGARLAVELINNAGGIRGADGTLFRLELAVQPLTAETASAAIVALDQQNVVAVIGPATNALTADNLTALQSLNVPVLTPAIGDTVLASDTTGRIFRARAAEVWQGRALADYLINVVGLSRIGTVQLDMDSTAGVIGFTTAASALQVQTSPVLLLEAESTTATLVQQVLVTSPQAVVIYGPSAAAAELYSALRSAGWEGLVAYPGAASGSFNLTVPFEQLSGIVGVMTWPFSAADSASVDFLTEYVRAYGVVPDELAAAGYDAVKLISTGITLPGELAQNIGGFENIVGVQGLFQPANLGRGDTTTDVAVVQLGAFGAPEVLARYRSGQRLPPEPEVAPTATPLPVTPTPEGVTITITGAQQNVRSGPGDQYAVIGVMQRGEQARVVGATQDNTWVVINYRGQMGWLVVYLLDVFGSLNTVPIVPPPPLPTPNFTPTPLLPPDPDIVIDAVTIQPQPIQPGQPFAASVTVRNQGLTPTGPFAIGATFPPSNTFASAVVGPLAPSQSVAVVLQAVLPNTGAYSASVIADINNQVFEGVTGESNNFFNVSYLIDVPLRSQGNQTLNLGDTIDVEDDAVQGDANWNGDGGVALDGLFGARLGILPAGDLNAIHWDVINPAIVNRGDIPRGELNPGTIIGIITADGNRGAMRVDAVSDQQLALSYKVYSR